MIDVTVSTQFRQVALSNALSHGYSDDDTIVAAEKYYKFLVQDIVNNDTNTEKEVQ